MRKLFFILMLCVCIGTRAQEKNETIIQYCLIMYNARTEALVLDMHTENQYFIIGDSDKRIVFPSSIALLNYMSEKGWEYVERFHDRNFEGTSMPCFLLKKQGLKDTEWFNGISFEKFK